MKVDYEVHNITGVESGFEYIKLPKHFSEDALRRYAERQKQKAVTISKNWSKEKQVEWILRNYLSLKMTLASTMLLNSAVFSNENNLQIVVPYLYYYSLLNTSRALLFSNPFIEWKQGGLISSTHQNTVNQVYNELRALSDDVADSIKKLLLSTKGYRELYSYRFPANGLERYSSNGESVIKEEVAINNARLLTEIAQFNSEIMQVTGDKHIQETFELTNKDLEEGYKYKGYLVDENEKPVDLRDGEDWYRLTYFVRKKIYTPTNLLWIAREGLIEDFFGAWTHDRFEDDEGAFDPDRDNNILLSPL
ncbi:MULTISPECIES: hypothetical protein [unclassified Bacillus (in: firmicutes)]|uniref:hypothetical protein n=1 Tax=unclassified Bacillus (in: firmicutes) TaxID=185979 RepID=UPI001BEA637B|nr:MULTISPECIES: hypothetical protein [unclassified Bacillus (in: firmicutes)]MBT2614439.1 hypothetical protein [Bacillus sp. ISL-78]MBT2628506.1 hypothetical protein [Bacillus sp. ISL-101]